MHHELIVAQFSKILTNLSELLRLGAKCAEEKKFEPEILWNARLAPDQFNLIRQVQITCDTAKLCAARLSGKEAPKHDDKEKSLADLTSRIDQTKSFLQSISAADLRGADERKITQPRWEGEHLTGQEYLIQHALPNFYFHLTTVYAILRHNGVEIGKKDYLGKLPLKK